MALESSHEWPDNRFLTAAGQPWLLSFSSDILGRFGSCLQFCGKAHQEVPSPPNYKVSNYDVVVKMHKFVQAGLGTTVLSKGAS